MHKMKKKMKRKERKKIRRKWGGKKHKLRKEKKIGQNLKTKRS